MEHIDCIKTWPAFYKITALVLDDCALDRTGAIEKWGAPVVALAEENHGKPVEEIHVRRLMVGLSEALGVAVVPVTPAGEPRTPPPSPPSVAGGPARKYPTTAPAKKRQVSGQVTELREEENRYSPGKPRLVMVVQEAGKKYGLAGTVPSSIKSSVEVGSLVTLRAEVKEFTDRPGFFKWPEKASIV
jgi:hypothetical protein